MRARGVLDSAVRRRPSNRRNAFSKIATASSSLRASPTGFAVRARCNRKRPRNLRITVRDSDIIVLLRFNNPPRPETTRDAARERPDRVAWIVRLCHRGLRVRHGRSTAAPAREPGCAGQNEVRMSSFERRISKLSSITSFAERCGFPFSRHIPAPSGLLPPSSGLRRTG